MSEVIATIEANFSSHSLAGRRLLLRRTPGPFKTYGKAAFTPEVAPQVLVRGRLVPACPNCGLLNVHDAGDNDLRCEYCGWRNR
jgi:hypothetical protein